MDKYDTLEYSRVKAITVFVRLQNFPCALTITNSPQLHLDPPFIGGTLNGPGGRLHGGFPKIHEQTTSSSYIRRPPIHIHDHHTHWKRRGGASHISISF
jgi:hypothetical protein